MVRQQKNNLHSSQKLFSGGPKWYHYWFPQQFPEQLALLNTMFTILSVTWMNLLMLLLLSCFVFPNTQIFSVTYQWVCDKCSGAGSVTVVFWSENASSLYALHFCQSYQGQEAINRPMPHYTHFFHGHADKFVKHQVCKRKKKE